MSLYILCNILCAAHRSCCYVVWLYLTKWAMALKFVLMLLHRIRYCINTCCIELWLVYTPNVLADIFEWKLHSKYKKPDNIVLSFLMSKKTIDVNIIVYQLVSAEDFFLNVNHHLAYQFSHSKRYTHNVIIWILRNTAFDDKCMT